MNLSKIFKSSKPAKSTDIQSEIKNCEEQRSEHRERLDNVTKLLQDKRIDEMCGQDVEGDVTALEAEQKSLEADIGTLDVIIQRLSSKLDEAVAHEHKTAINLIDKELAALRKKQSDLTDKLLKSSGEAAGISFLLRGSNAFTVGPRTLPLALAGDDSQAFYDSFQKVVGAEIPLTQKIQDLVERKNTLLGIENTVNWLAAPQ